MLANAEAMSPQDPELIRLKAYIEGMETVEMLLNLDRPVMQSEVDQAAYAMSQADMLIRVAPESADGHVLKGQLYASLDRLELAGASIDTAIAIEPENSFAWVRRGLLLYNTYQSTEEPADLDAAFAALERARTLDPASKWPPLWLGILEYEANLDDAAAMSRYEEALANDPEFTLAMQGVGDIHLYNEDFESSEAMYWSILKLEPDNARAWRSLGFILGYQDDYGPALTNARIATEKDPNQLEAWLLRGLVAYEMYKRTLMRTGRLDEGLANESIDSYSSAIRLDPRNAEGYFRRSTLHLALGDVSSAGDDARLAVKFDPWNEDARIALADYQLRLGLEEQALDSYRSASRLAAEYEYEHEEALAGEAEVLGRLGRHEEAEAAFNAALAATTEDLAAVVRTRFGRYLESRGRTEEALATYVAARTEDPSYYDAWAAEADLRLSSGDVDGARPALDQCRQLGPEAATTSRLLERAEAASEG